MAGRLGAKKRVLALGAAVGLCQTSSYQVATQRSCSLHLDPAALETQHQTASHAILCRVRVSGRGGARPAPQHREASHGALGSARLHRGGNNTSITTKAWRRLSWTFEEAPRLAARAAREHLNGTLFDETEMEQEEPPEETDLILDDDGCCGGSRAFLHGGFPSRTRRTLLVSALRVRQASTKTLSTNCFQADAGPNMCSHRAVAAHVSGLSLQSPRSWRSYQVFKCFVAEQSDMGCVIFEDRVVRIHLAHVLCCCDAQVLARLLLLA